MSVLWISEINVSLNTTILGNEACLIEQLHVST